MFFGLPQGTFSTATQAAIYIQAPAEQIGAAAGLQLTAQYIGAIAAHWSPCPNVRATCDRSRPA
jgi:hypothetical protein